MVSEFCRQTGRSNVTLDDELSRHFPHTITKPGGKSLTVFDFREEDLAVEDPDYYWVLQRFETEAVGVDHAREYYAGAGFLRALLIFTDETNKLNYISRELVAMQDQNSGLSDSLREIKKDITLVGSVGKIIISAYWDKFRKKR